MTPKHPLGLSGALKNPSWFNRTLHRQKNPWFRKRTIGVLWERPKNPHFQECKVMLWHCLCCCSNMLRQSRHIITLRKSSTFRKVYWSVPFVCLHVCLSVCLSHLLQATVWHRSRLFFLSWIRHTQLTLHFFVVNNSQRSRSRSPKTIKTTIWVITFFFCRHLFVCPIKWNNKNSSEQRSSSKVKGQGQSQRSRVKVKGKKQYKI